MKTVWRKHFGTLRPADPQAEEQLRKVKNGDLVTVEMKRPRNPQHHRLLFALLNIVVENQEHYKTVDHLLAALKVATGHCDEYPLKNGKGVVMIPRSISFSSMSQDEFEPFFERCLEIICSQIIPGTVPEDLRQEVLNQIGGYDAQPL